ncbi:hypothetical protein C8R45DRAFT_934759 [Mycena sanguinolenta]|nr:hypothetical protein C8R45DRAFT_934759 [Mycena sanguinolenta]
MERTSKKVGKEAVSVYKHSTTKGYQDLISQSLADSRTTVPSQKAIYEKMLAKDDNFSSTLILKNKNTTKHELEAYKKEISSHTTKLRDQIAIFRQDQRILLAKVGDKVAIQTAAVPVIKDECLYLPSDLSTAERQQFNLKKLAAEEAPWREKEVFDILQVLQHVVKGISALHNHKAKNDRHQKQNSRAGDQICEALTRQNHHIESYNAARAVIWLNRSSNFPALTENNLFMKSVQQKRHVRDSKRTDGLLFEATAMFAIRSPDEDSDVDMVNVTTDANNKSADDGTVQIRTKAQKADKRYCWVIDRVESFRAEADMDCWQEQIEQKLTELLHTGRSFVKMQSMWSQLATISKQDGAAAYAC